MYLNALAQSVPSAANMRRYAEIVRERAVLRKLVAASDEIATAAFNPNGRNVSEILDEAEGKIFRIGEEGSKSQQGFQSMDSLVVQLLETNVNATLHALAQEGKLDVLSRPYILASDNQLAAITVGSEVPFITNSILTENGQTINNIDYQDDMPPAVPPDMLLPVEQQLSPYAAEFGGFWVNRRAFDTRYVDPPPRLALDQGGSRLSVSRIWLRADGVVPQDPVVNGCVVAYLSALTLLESAMTRMGKASVGTGVSALLDHTTWFHRPADFSDWLLFDQRSPSGVAGRALVTGTMYNRNGDLVCTASQEGYFGRRTGASAPGNSALQLRPGRAT